MATRLCFDPAGGFLLSGREDGTILVYALDDLTTGTHAIKAKNDNRYRTVVTSNGHGAHVTACCFDEK